VKLITQFRPISTRSSDVRIPPKNVALVVLDESNKSGFSIFYDDSSPFVGGFIGYLPVKDCGIRVSPKEIAEFKKKTGKHAIFINDSILKTNRSVVVDLTSVLNRLSKRGIRYPYTEQYKKFMAKCLQNLGEKLVNYDYKFIHEVVDLASIDSNFSMADLRKMKIFSIFSLLEDDVWKEKFDALFGKIFLTLKTKTGDVINLLLYDKNHKTYSNPETVRSKLIALIRYFNRNEKVDNELDKKVNVIKSKLKEVIHNKDTRELVKNDIDVYASKYPDEIADAKELDNAAHIKKLAAKAVKAVVTDDDYVEDHEVNTILHELTQIQIKNPVIPKKVTNDDVISEVRQTASPPQVGNVVEARKVAFKNLENFVKLFNSYFKRIGYRIIKVERAPVEDNDIATTELETLEITIEDLRDNQIFEIQLDIPKIIDDNYFLYNGVKRVLIHQLFPLPVISYRSGEVIIRTNFANATITYETRFKTKSFYAVVLGKKVPVILLFIIYHRSLGNFLKAFNINYEIVDKPDKDTYKLTETQYLKLLDDDPVLKALFNSLKLVKHMPESDQYELWLKSLQKMVSQRFATLITDYLDRFIDPLTYYILKTEDLPETVDGLFWYACQLAYNGIVTSQTDLRYRRIRSVEVLAVLLYKRLYFELYKYRTQQELSFGSTKKATIKIPRNALINDLTSGTDAVSQFQQVDAINPVIESSYVTRVTYAGYGGIKSENVPMSMRNVDPTYFGTICPVDTPECIDPHTKVFKLNGTIVEEVELKDIKPGDKVLGRYDFVTVLKRFDRYKEAYEIELDDGTKIIASGDHRFPVYDTQKQMEVLLPLEQILEDPDRYEFIAR